MEQTQIIVRTSKSTGVYNRANSYTLFLNGKPCKEVNYLNNRIILVVEAGLNVVEIKNENTTIRKELNLRNGQQLTITINASATYKLSLGILIGIAIVGVIIQLIIAKKVILPLIFIPFISLLFFKKENYPNSFELTIN
ncbi:hypothetical protein [Flavobacterium franklandianum]|uniref:PEGA domain-containing protein n=1 Tax=Flavobacterium franklandianum TaxID=2594430 RepID=A0A553C643_9FLAO|nr:hypothetical protein [Flavobacterium franklandianum]TRX15999.1 hypothetical protein FNW17_15480 [Flavobacterium franklandianum]